MRYSRKSAGQRACEACDAAAAAYKRVVCVCVFDLLSQVTKLNNLQPRKDHHGEGHTGGFVQSRGGDNEETEGGPRERRRC